MPRNSSGTYTLPVAAFVAGTTIKSVDANSNNSDISTALTQSLATTGVSSMTGPVKLSAGSAAAPSLTLAADTDTGWYNSAAGAWTFVSNTTPLMTIGPTEVSIEDLDVVNLTVTGSFSVASARLVGEVVDYCGAAAPALWLLAFGQAISRTTYASAFGVLGTTFGAGDGLTTFNLPDYRGRIGVGKDNMGGSTAGRITAAGCGITGTTLGATGGLETHVLVTAELAIHSHGINDPTHSHTIAPTAAQTSGGAAAGGGATGSAAGAAATAAAATLVTIQNTGSGTAHNNTQPTLIVNKIIYVAV